MKRVLIALITALPLVVGVAGAQADGGSGGPWSSGEVAVAGTVVAPDSANGTFTANAYVVAPPTPGSDDGGDGTGGSGPSGPVFGGDAVHHLTTSPAAPSTPATTPVTISTSASTMIRVSGVDGPATVADLATGDRFIALFPGAPTDPITTIVGNPATSVFAQVPKQFYAFVGTAGTPDTTNSTVPVTVMRSLPASLIAANTSATFQLGPHTLVIGGTSLSTSSISDPFGSLFGGSISDIQPGDLLAGGLIGPGGMTAAQVQSTPLMFVLDLPAPATTPTTGSGTTTSAANQALKETLKLLSGGKVTLKKKTTHKKSHHATKKSKHAKKA
ncbi:MAG TPA: hypothetical protein VG186_03750 [Solirubrobacteraceae bacterium]|jgi:hypothetical protein|nr:hypothetical protein [Solirubrobacteraceae bacterium]